MAERGEKKGFIEKIAEWSKKLDIFLIGSGIVLLYVVPNVGVALIVGSALTIIPANMLEKWAKNRSKK